MKEVETSRFNLGLRNTANFVSRLDVPLERVQVGCTVCNAIEVAFQGLPFTKFKDGKFRG